MKRLIWTATNTPGLYVGWIAGIMVSKYDGKYCIGSMEVALIKFSDENGLYKFLTI